MPQGYTEDRPPSLEELKPSRRTVAFGKFRENPDEHGLKLEPHQEYIDHTAWHGRSGGMVCVYDGGNKKAWVCGIGKSETLLSAVLSDRIPSHWRVPCSRLQSHECLHQRC